jgi:alpha-galactosidase
VITALEVDRFKYWGMDFHIPRIYGFKQVFGENGGPGGIFHALRNMGPILEVARTMQQVCPDALLLNFSNPEHKLCEAVSRLTGIRNAGLCHGYFMGREQIVRILDMPSDRVRTHACGINHFTWFDTITDTQTGEDLYPLLRERERVAPWNAHWHELALGRVLLRTFGLWPSPATNHYGEYIRWAGEFMASEMNFYYDAVEGEPWKRGVDAGFVYTIDSVQTHVPWGPAAQPAPQDPSAAPLKPSGEVAVPIIESVVLNRPALIDAVNVVNGGTIPNLDSRQVIECSAQCDAHGLKPVVCRPLPEPIAAMIRTQGSINALTVEAYAERSRTKLLQAVLLDPCVDSYRNAVRMVDELLRLQAGILPTFE